MIGRALLGRKIGVLAAGTTLVSVIGSTIPGEAVATEERRSGTVLAIEQLDQATATLVLRVGPWRIKDEDVVPGNVPLNITLKPSTEILVVTRVATAGSNGKAGDLIKASASTELLKPGVFVTVTFTQSGPELVANSVEVMPDPLSLYPDPPAAPSSLAVHPK